MHYGDIVGLRESDIISENGKQYIKSTRQKTGEPFYVPLMNPVQKVMATHRQYKRVGDRVFAFSCEQVLNRNLKRLATHLSIPKKITCKVGRHTFATTVTLEQDVPLETVSKMLGHSKITTTMIYAHILQSKIDRDMDGVAAKFG